MRKLFQNFKKSESGASLVEYAVALIVVTIIGGAGVLVIGQNGGDLVEAGCDVLGAGGTAAIAAANSTTTTTDAAMTAANCG